MSGQLVDMTYDIEGSFIAYELIKEAKNRGVFHFMRDRDTLSPQLKY